VAKTPIKLDVQPPFADDHVEVFSAVGKTPRLTSPHWETVASSQLCVADL
jgi:hypothetical protein